VSVFDQITDFDLSLFKDNTILHIKCMTEFKKVKKTAVKAKKAGVLSFLP
jgi:hypothetical protein